MSLDEYLDKNLKIYRAGVGKIISALFYSDKNRNYHGETSGSVLHYRLGFINDSLFCRYIDLSYMDINGYLHLCGTPDRIISEDNNLYVDELKTTSSRNHLDFIYAVGYAQLQLYMLLTGIKKGRVYVYIKDEDEMLYRKVEYNESFAKGLIRDYINLLENRTNIVNKIKSKY